MKNKHLPCKESLSNLWLPFNNQPKDDTTKNNDKPSVDDATRKKILTSLMGLASVKGIGFKTLQAMFDVQLLHNFADLNLEEISHKLKLSSIKEENLAKVIYEKKENLLEKGTRIAEDLHKQGIIFIPLGHTDYPEALYKLKIPPRWIFVKGNLEVIHSKSIIAVIGTRNPSKEGEILAYHLAKELAVRNFVVLSGLAKGIDEKAHQGAVEYYGQSIAILGHGINYKRFASKTRDLVSQILDYDGAIISEYLPDEFPSSEKFLRRNELISAMANLIIPVEMPSLQSGTGSTIRRALVLKTPVIGITKSNTQEKSLIKTKENLSQLNIRVFTLSKDNSTDFWNHLKTVFPDHSWNIDPAPRRKRLFQIIKNQIKKARNKVPIDHKVIDDLCLQLKQGLCEDD